MADSMPSKLRNIPAGFSSSMDFTMYFNHWAAQMRRLPSAKDIQSHFGVSRATAYRWVRAYKDAIDRNNAWATA